jgi:hypothetical protein
MTTPREPSICPRAGPAARRPSSPCSFMRWFIIFKTCLVLKYECPQEREKLAYIAQDRWLGLFGHSLTDDFALDPFSLFVKTKCFY